MTGHRRKGGKCSICNKTQQQNGEAVYAFTDVLREMCLVGDRAHVTCVQKWRRKIQRRIEMAGNNGRLEDVFTDAD